MFLTRSTLFGSPMSAPAGARYSPASRASFAQERYSAIPSARADLRLSRRDDGSRRVARGSNPRARGSSTPRPAGRGPRISSRLPKLFRRDLVSLCYLPMGKGRAPRIPTLLLRTTRSPLAPDYVPPADRSFFRPILPVIPGLIRSVSLNLHNYMRYAHSVKSALFVTCEQPLFLGV
jgi:hypothetical protein